MSIGKKIKQISENKGISPSDIASKLDKSTTAVYDIFKKEHVNTLLLEQLAQILGVDVVDFFLPSQNVKGDTSLTTVHHVGGDFKNVGVLKKNHPSTTDCKHCERLLEERGKLLEEKERVIRLQNDLIESLRGGK